MQMEEALPAAELAYSLRRVYGVHGNYAHQNPKGTFRFLSPFVMEVRRYVDLGDTSKSKTYIDRYFLISGFPF